MSEALGQSANISKTLATILLPNSVAADITS